MGFRRVWEAHSFVLLTAISFLIGAIVLFLLCRIWLVWGILRMAGHIHNYWTCAHANFIHFFYLKCKCYHFRKLNTKHDEYSIYTYLAFLVGLCFKHSSLTSCQCSVWIVHDDLNHFQCSTLSEGFIIHIFFADLVPDRCSWCTGKGSSIRVITFGYYQPKAELIPYVSIGKIIKFW